MTAIRQQGKINDNTTLIDIGMSNVQGMTAIYLLQGEKKCLIDGGTFTEAPRMVKILRELNAFPPDLIIATHPHWDHTQGIPYMRQIASEEGQRIEVVAAHNAIPLMADTSFNDDFNCGPYYNIENITPVKEGDILDLGGINLQIHEVPGHCKGHIAIFDAKNGNLFIGDAVGYKVSDDCYISPFMPPTWDTNDFLSSINKMKEIPYESICLAHFGCISGSEAKKLLNEAIESYNTWWGFFEKYDDKLNDIDFLLQAMREEINPIIPNLKPMTLNVEVLFSVASIFVNTVLGRKTKVIDKMAFGEILGWLASGYKIYKETH